MSAGTKKRATARDTPRFMMITAEKSHMFLMMLLSMLKITVNAPTVVNVAASTARKALRLWKWR